MEWYMWLTALVATYLATGIVAAVLYPTPPGWGSFGKAILLRPIKIVAGVIDFFGLAFSLIWYKNSRP